MKTQTVTLQRGKEPIEGSLTVTIPEGEMFRVQEIFSRHGYALPFYGMKNRPFTVLDIGANVGLFALYMHMQNPSAALYCYEPAPDTFKLLEANTAHLANCVRYNIALSDKTGTFPFYCHPQSTGGHSLTTQEGRMPSSYSVPVQDAGATIAGLELPVIDVLKIDTEGSEIPILTSMGELVDKATFVLLEYHSEKDRRHFDELLQDFILFSAASNQPHLGVVKYIHKRAFAKA